LHARADDHWDDNSINFFSEVHMQVGGVDSAAKVDVGGTIAIKVLKDQLDMQAQMIESLTQPTLVYDSNGGVHSAPPQTSFDVKM
jgi:hypothetical protein